MFFANCKIVFTTEWKTDVYSTNKQTGSSLSKLSFPSICVPGISVEHIVDQSARFVISTVCVTVQQVTT